MSAVPHNPQTHPPTASSCRWEWHRTLLSHVALAGYLALVLITRFYALPTSVSRSGVFFADADCYSRMTRAALILEGKGLIQSHHSFENAPDGTTPHTTALLDWLIALGAKSCGNLDLAGALIPPALALIGGTILWFWTKAWRGPPRWAPLLLYAASPALAFATALGRPDHQALLIPLLTLALCAQWHPSPTPRKELLAGLAWGCALWVSLYEPAILWIASLAARAIADPKSFRSKPVLAGIAATLLAVAVATLMEGWRVQLPPASLRAFGARWASSIGELQPLWKQPWLLFQWTGFGLIATPFLLLFPIRSLRERIPQILMLSAVITLSLATARWTTYLALIYAITLPVQLRGRRSNLLLGLAAAACLWPVFQEWDRLLDLPHTKLSELDRSEMVNLRQASAAMQANGRGNFLAAWWLSPPIAYWSGSDGVAGSSHEALSGTRDSALFFAGTSDTEALQILERRKVRYVVSTDPDPLATNSYALLGIPLQEQPLCERLFRQPGHPPLGLRCIWSSGTLHVLERSEPKP